MQITTFQGKLVLLLLGTAAIFVLVTIFTTLNERDVLSRIKAKYKNVEVTNATVLSYDAQKVYASSDNKKIRLKVVEGLDKKVAPDIIKKLESEITAPREKHTSTDPYTGKETDYSIPDEFQPIGEEISIGGSTLGYYVVYANEIFSYFVSSQEQAKFKGISSVFACGNNIYKIDIFSPADSFNKNEVLGELRELYCR